jgi:ankyrin repeat protein
MKSSTKITGSKRKKFRGYEIRRFLRACKQGRLAEVKKLLSEGHDPNGHDDIYGHRPLHVVAENGHISVARVLLAAGADIEAQVGYGGVDRPLDCAAERGQLKMLQFLIKRGARINVRGHSRALFLAIHSNREAAVIYLLRKGASLPNDGLYWAVRTGNLKLVELILKAGADIHGDGSKNVPVRAAVRLESGAEMLEMLVRYGADLHTKGDKDQTTLLDIVNNEDAALLLIDSGLRVDTADCFGETPLHRCAKKGFLRACRRLLEKGADPRIKSGRGLTPRQQVSNCIARNPNHDLIYDLLTEALKRTAPARAKKVAGATTR